MINIYRVIAIFLTDYTFSIYQFIYTIRPWGTFQFCQIARVVGLVPAFCFCLLPNCPRLPPNPWSANESGGRASVAGQVRRPLGPRRGERIRRPLYHDRIWRALDRDEATATRSGDRSSVRCRDEVTIGAPPRRRRKEKSLLSVFSLALAPWTRDACWLLPPFFFRDSHPSSQSSWLNCYPLRIKLV